MLFLGSLGVIWISCMQADYSMSLDYSHKMGVIRTVDGKSGEYREHGTDKPA